MNVFLFFGDGMIIFNVYLVINIVEFIINGNFIIFVSFFKEIEYNNVFSKNLW